MPTDSYTSTTTWICPAGVSHVDVEVWGAGGSGGYADGTGKQVGSGGGGGAYSKKLAVPVQAGHGYTATCGAPGARVPGLDPTSGGDSWFLSSGTVLAKGGHSVIGSEGFIAGQGGQASGGIGDTKFSGGNGGTGVNAKTSSGGGGGSSAGSAANGNNGTNGAGLAAQPGGSAPTGGGAGGASGTSDDSTAIAVNGSAPGGGGGGGTYSGVPNCGSGGPGKVSITYTQNFGAFDEHSGYDAKPGKTARVNLALPTSHGMCGCFLFNERGGTIARDLVGKMGDVAFSSSPVWNMRGIAVSGATGCLSKLNGIVSNFNPVAGNCSLRIIHVPKTWPGTYTCLVEVYGTGGAGRLWAIFTDGTNITYRAVGGGDGSPAPNTLTMPVKTLNDLVFVRRLNDTSTGSTQVHYWYLNGKLIFKETGFTNNSWSAGYTLTFGGNPSGGGSLYDGTYLKAQMWNRALHAQEVGWLAAHPWDDIVKNRYSRRERFKTAAAAAPRKPFGGFGWRVS